VKTVLLACAGLLACAVQVETETPPQDRILVMPFENVARDGRIFWIGEASAVLLTDDLGALGANAISRREREQAFTRLQVPPVATLTDATIIRIGQVVGAATVVIGSLQMDGDTLKVRARSIALDAGRVQADATERGPLADLYATFERLARRLGPPSGRTSEEVERQHPPMAVFENYIKGLLAETPATAIDYLNAALKQQAGFDQARLALWDLYTDQGDYDEALAVVTRVPAASSDARRATFLAGLSQLDLKRLDEASDSFTSLAASQPTAAVLNNLGVVQMRRGAPPQAEQPTDFFKQAADIDPGDPDYAFNLGYAYWLGHDLQSALYWLRETVRRNPADGDAHYILGTALSAAGSVPEASREKELARRLSSAYVQWDKRPPNDPVPRGLERVKMDDVALPHASRIDTKLTSGEQRDQAELARFHFESGRRLYERENDREAAAELGRALYLSPYFAEAHLLMGRIYLRNGQLRAAIDAFKISLWSTDTAEGHAALGEAYRQDKQVAAARAEAERALALDSTSVAARRLLALLDAR